MRAAAVVALFSAASACRAAPPPVRSPADVESRVLLRRGGLTVQGGGYGSAMAAHPSRPGLIYLLADRGPNIQTRNEDEKAFAIPRFAPQIGLFEREADGYQRVEVIEIKDASGRPVTGLPNPAGQGGTGETAVDLDGRPLGTDLEGIDPEGLAALQDGTFWVSDEYGPHLLHLDRAGRTLERINPFRPSGRGRALPRVLARRRPNRGMEGLTATPDGRALVGILQSALDNPGPAVRKTARATRILWFDLESGATRQFVYMQEQPQNSNTEIAALSHTEFLIVERDDGFAGDPASPARIKRVYRVDAGAATDVGDPADAVPGRLFGGKTLEALSDAEAETAGIRPVAKTLLVDLLRLPGGYPHDKPEGLLVLDDRLLAVCNDDDFGLTSDESGRPVAKVLPGPRPILDRNRIYFIEVPPLPVSPAPAP